jgi:lipopolysaccharide export system permease protein
LKELYKKYWTILDAYVLRKLLTTFVFSICIIALIACVIDYAEKVDDFVKNKPTTFDLIVYYVSFIPHITALLFPLFIFISTIFFTSKMAFRTEIIAILAAGVSFTRFLRPYVVGGFILVIVSLVANHFVVPFANHKIHEFYVKFIWNNPYEASRDVHIRLSPNEYIYVQNFDYTQRQMMRFTLEYIEDNKVTYKLSANKGTYDTLTKIWFLDKVQKRTLNGKFETLEYIDKDTIRLALTPEDILNDDRKNESLTTPHLLKAIDKQKERGLGTVDAYLFELHKRTSQPFAGLILCIIGGCLASKKVRGGSGFHLAIGIGGCAIYMLFMQFSRTFTVNAGFNPFLSVWIPNIIFGTVAYIMYRQKIK